MPQPWVGLKEQKSLVELKSANGCVRSINTGFPHKLLERMNMPKISHFQIFGASRFFTVSKQNLMVYLATHERTEIKFCNIWSSGFWGNVWNLNTKRVLGQRPNNDLGILFSQIMYSCIKTNLITIFRPKSSKLSMKSYVLVFFHIWPCNKIGQGQPKVIIWAILLVLWYPMLHIMFHRSIGSGKEDF